jgi:muramoyltetrapeptide carboxypeptidase
MHAFADENIHGIICARGGYGAAQLLPLLDFALPRRTRKFFMGFSDVTALHIALNNIGVPTFHGPMVATECFQSHFHEPRLEAVFERCAQDFTAAAVGGNLSVICSTLGTPYEICTKNKILFMEDTNEPPYKIDRLLTQLKLAGKLDDAAGFMLGDFSPETPDTLAQAFSILPQKKPLITGLKCGHTTPNYILPLGAEITVSAHPPRTHGHPETAAAHIQFLPHALPWENP